MRYLIAHRTNAHWEAGASPTPELIQRVGGLMGELAAAGILRAGEGLRASAEGVRLVFAGGVPTVVPGPFGATDALPAGFVIVKVASLDDATTWATRLAGILGDVAFDVRPVTEAWDIGLEPIPEGLATRRWMLLHTSPTGGYGPLSPDGEAEMRRLLDEMARAGVLLAAEGLAPVTRAVRVKAGRKPTMLDGPFAESKELIAGYAIVEVPSLPEAAALGARYLEVVGAAEVDVRELLDGIGA